MTTTIEDLARAIHESDVRMFEGEAVPWELVSDHGRLVLRANARAVVLALADLVARSRYSLPAYCRLVALVDEARAAEGTDR